MNNQTSELSEHEQLIEDIVATSSGNSVAMLASDMPVPTIPAAPVNLGEVAEEIVGGLLGEIVSCEPPKEINYALLISEMVHAKLNVDYAKEMLPKNALRRAMKDMDEGMVIRKIKDTGSVIEFQFTSETATGNGFKYDPQDYLSMDTKTGDCTALNDPALAELAMKLVNQRMGVRSTSDISKIFMKTFEAESGIFSFRKSGGVYFVPIASQGLIVRFEEFISRIGGYLGRVQVPGGSVNLGSMAKTVVDGTRGIIKEYQEAIEGYSEITPMGVTENRAEVIQELRQRKLALREFFGHRIDELDQDFEELDKMLAAKQEEIVRGKTNASSQGSEVPSGEPDTQRQSAFDFGTPPDLGDLDKDCEPIQAFS